jgi:hypothetical protein
MLDENREDKKSKRKEFEEVLNGLKKKGWHYHTAALAVARRCEEGRKEGTRRRIAEPLVLTEEEKRFDEEDKREETATRSITCEEYNKLLASKTEKWWYTSALIHAKKDLNKMKEIYKLALEAQEEICSELEAEAKSEENKEWFKSLSHEDKIAARGALGKQRVGSTRLQNEILQIWEDQLDRFVCQIKGFPARD